jgi:hypothetical protein
VAVGIATLDTTGSALGACPEPCAPPPSSVLSKLNVFNIAALVSWRGGDGDDD